MRAATGIASAAALSRAHARRLREIYRSAGWPCQDTVEIELLAGGFVQRVTGDGGHVSLQVTEAGIAPGLFGDAYVALGEPLGGGSWALRVHVKPFVRWIWAGALLMALGGFVTATDERFRATRKERA